MHKEYYNPEQIVSVKALDLYRESRFMYKKGIKLIGFVIKKPCFKDDFALIWDLTLSKEDILKNRDLTIIDNKVFTKHRVVITFSNDSTKIKYFNSFNEAFDYAERLKERYKFIEL